MPFPYCWILLKFLEKASAIPLSDFTTEPYKLPGSLGLPMIEVRNPFHVCLSREVWS